MSSLDQHIIKCNKCPRLIQHCQTIAKEKKKAYHDWNYWGKPVPNFGSEASRLLIVGLAPAAHGANRTGRMFTGDRSGQWLYRALHKAKFANQSSFERTDDGLVLKDCLITAVNHCAPPDNKLTPTEIENCRHFLESTIQASKPKAILCLGQIAWTEVFKYLKRSHQYSEKLPKFSHLSEVEIHKDLKVFASYHPSQQNTFTGKLTEPLFDSVFEKIRSYLK